MRLSIIVPVYNMAAEGKLNFCMNSLVNQSIDDYEVIAVDDASTDHSLAILREYEESYPEKVRIIACPENRRQGGAKNEGLKAARGEWIGFIDSDDWVTFDYYGKLLDKAEETGADLVGCDYNLVEDHTYEVGKVIQNNASDQTGILDVEKHKELFMRPGSMVVKIYRADVIRQNDLHFPEGIFYEDNCAGSLWSLYFKHFERVEEPLYYYYQHQVSTVHHVSEQKCRDRMQSGEQLLIEMRDRGFLDDYGQELEYRFTELYFVNTLFSYMSGAKKRRLSFVKELKKRMLEAFPAFAQNPYYLRYTGEEEKKMINLLMHAAPVFYWYYRALWLYRGMRKKR